MCSADSAGSNLLFMRLYAHRVIRPPIMLHFQRCDGHQLHLAALLVFGIANCLNAMYCAAKLISFSQNRIKLISELDKAGRSRHRLGCTNCLLRRHMLSHHLFDPDLQSAKICVHQLWSRMILLSYVIASKMMQACLSAAISDDAHTPPPTLISRLARPFFDS